jgi:predicted adenine nucleotide alpha hydrolase (AANH) superfamily ATPase
MGWLDGIKISKEMGMYRQPYCGCIYSEKERFYPAKGGYKEKPAKFLEGSWR